jgi:hypothetical protein
MMLVTQGDKPSSDAELRRTRDVQMMMKRSSDVRVEQLVSAQLRRCHHIGTQERQRARATSS